MAALRCGGSEAQALDLILDQYSEFTVEGPAPVHVTGALSRPQTPRDMLPCARDSALINPASKELT